MLALASAVVAVPALARASTPAASGVASAPVRQSGFDFMSPATQALQKDDSQNPAFLWVQGGRERFAADCQRCHALESLRSAAARHPAWHNRLGKPVTLAARIQHCQISRVRGAALADEGADLLGLEAVVALQAQGLPIEAPSSDARLRPAIARGEALYRQRIGQLALSCAQCHDQQAGRRLGGSLIPQGHPTGYPLYRLEWQGIGSLQRRLRHCMTGVRAEPYAYGSDELTALELYLKQRAAGMPIESPAVRP